MPSHPLALPQSLSPDALDTLTEMATVIARLRAAIQASGPTAGSQAGITGATPAATPNTPSGLAGAAALSLKEIPAVTDTLKHKLQRARVQVRALPEMSRTVEEQEAEIRDLEERIRRQREVLETFREAGVEFVQADGADTKMEL